jgi:4-amino-4-deoxy-L-arabinose transferase-like glycosyltransferase
MHSHTTGWTLALFGMILLGYLVAVAWAVPYITGGEMYHFSKYPDGYGEVAASVARHEGYRFAADGGESMFREPAYILTVAGIFSLFGESPTAARLLNVLLVGLSAYLVWFLSRFLGASRRAAIIATLVFLVFPHIVFSALRVSPEIFYVTLLLAFVTLFLLGLERRKAYLFALAGVVFGLSVITRSLVLLLLPLILGWAGWMLWRRVSLKRATVLLGVFVLAFLFVYAPWPLRNLALSGRLVLTATSAGQTFFQSMYVSKHPEPGREYDEVLEDATTQQKEILAEEGIPFTASSGFFQYHVLPRDEIRQSDALIKYAITAYMSEPKLMLKTMARNLYSFWIKGRKASSSWINSLIIIPLLVVSFWKIYRFTRSGPVSGYLVFLLLFCGGFYLAHLPFLAHSRHCVPLIPFLLVFAALPSPRFLLSSIATTLARGQSKTQPLIRELGDKGYSATLELNKRKVPTPRHGRWGCSFFSGSSGLLTLPPTFIQRFLVGRGDAPERGAVNGAMHLFAYQ